MENPLHSPGRVVKIEGDREQVVNGAQFGETIGDECPDKIEDR